jgi:hypothetical protein
MCSDKVLGVEAPQAGATSLAGNQSAAQLAAGRAAEVRDRGEMSQNEFLDWLIASGHLTKPWFRVTLVQPGRAQRRAAPAQEML